jgi:DNA-binding IscR family transcriptional regulator
VEQIDGPPTVFSCVTFEDICHLGGSCHLQTVFARAQEAMLEVLMGTTIAECVSNKTCLPDPISTTRA